MHAGHTECVVCGEASPPGFHDLRQSYARFAAYKYRSSHTRTNAVTHTRTQYRKSNCRNMMPSNSVMLGRSNSIVSKLQHRQLGTRQRRLYTQVPARLQFPIESVVDKDKHLLGCILLGFSADGDHLLSYTSTGGYHLQVWSYLWGEQAKLLVNFKLFEGASSMTGDEDSDSSDEDARDNPLGLAVSVTETSDQQLLIVHGASPFRTADEDSLLLDTLNYVTVLPNPCLYRCLQGCHFKYASIRWTISQPLFAFLPPDILVMYSSHGIQFVHLLTKHPQTTPWQAQGPSLHLQPAQQTAAPETNTIAVRVETADSQQPVHADPASSQHGRSSSMDFVQRTDVHQMYMHADGQGPSKATVSESGAAANSMPSMSAASQAEPTHSVWSMSASSEASSSDQGGSESSSGSPVSNSFAPHAVLPDAIASPNEHGVDSDVVSFFTVCLGGAGRVPQPVHCSVTAAMETPAFDPETFIMDHIPNSMLQHHRLTDYAVELLGDGTSTEYQQHNCCSTFHKQQAAQHDASQKSVLLLIVAMLKPTFITINPPGCVKCTVLTVSVHVPSGVAELLSQRWVKPESVNQVIDSIAYDHPTDVCKLAALCLAKKFASGLKSDCVAPQAPRQAAVVLTNEAMLISGKSAGVLLHPFLPICILGYRHQNQLNDT